MGVLAAVAEFERFADRADPIRIGTREGRRKGTGAPASIGPGADPHRPRKALKGPLCGCGGKGVRHEQADQHAPLRPLIGKF
ncbi:hypothetical protein D3C71_2071810 [compost metagenome]